MTRITCGYCGQGFGEDQGQPTCASCPLRGGCRFLRCPHCGYENPASPAWVAKLRGWLDTRAAATAPAPEPSAESRVRGA